MRGDLDSTQADAAGAVPEVQKPVLEHAAPKRAISLSVPRFARRFWEKVSVKSQNECWEWTGLRSSDNYGVTYFFPKRVRAHRASLFLTNGVWPAGAVLHRCNNPPCVNPAHLYVGTQKENVRDMIESGRIATGDRHGSRTRPDRIAKGALLPQSKLQEQDVRRIKRLLNEGASHCALAREFGVSAAAIDRIASGRNWKHVQGD